MTQPLHFAAASAVLMKLLFPAKVDATMFGLLDSLYHDICDGLVVVCSGGGV